jgi:Transposase DNA-binding/Transposase Tn5 dimerisation domain
MQSWLTEETATCDFGDARLDKRYQKLLDRAVSKPSLSIPGKSRGRAELEATYRFLKNEKVTPAKILLTHRSASMERMRREEVVLIPQDTTQIDLTRKKEKVGGPLDEGYHWGVFAHVQLAMTVNKIPLGVVGADIWARDPKEVGIAQAQKREKRRASPIEEKESVRWLQGYRAACQLAEELPDTQVVSIADSESDIYECFMEAGKADWIVRGCQDRALAEKAGLLRAKLLSAPLFSSWEIEVSRREAKTGNGRKRTLPREARTAKVEARAMSVELRPPARPDGVKLPVVSVNVVMVREISPPAGEEPIEWMLLTSLPIATVKQVELVVEYYCARWEIEIYFRTLKSGCGVEKLQLEKVERVQNCVALYLVVAWRVLYLLMKGREDPSVPCTEVFEESEWKAVYSLVHEKAKLEDLETVPTLGEMIKWVASLGGYMGRKYDGPPGPKTFWIGHQRMYDLAAGWELATKGMGS